MSASADSIALGGHLARILDDDQVLTGAATAAYCADATESSGIRGRADAVVLPRTTDEVARVVGWCYRNDVPLVPRGGGTGLAGGCVPDGGVVIALAGLNRIRSIEPLLWRCEVEAGVTTRRVQQSALENGLAFPPDPGAAEESHIGGNVATDAGGPSAFKYGTVGAWVTGLEVVVAPGETIRVGGPIRKDSSGYDLVSLVCGSEGTLGIVTSVWLRLIPAVEARRSVVAFYDTIEAGCLGVQTALASGVVPSAIEFFDGECLAVVASGLPLETPGEAAMMLVVEVDGDEEEAAAAQALVAELLSVDALALETIDREAVPALRRWREGVSGLVRAWRGGKCSEDIVVPIDRLADAIESTRAIGARHGLQACSWGHAGDGNLHSTLMIDPTSQAEIDRAGDAIEDLFALAASLGGSVSGEHGLGIVKSGQLDRQWPERALALHEAVKRGFDPKGLLNPGKKLARRP